MIAVLALLLTPEHHGGEGDPNIQNEPPNANSKNSIIVIQIYLAIKAVYYKNKISALLFQFLSQQHKEHLWRQNIFEARILQNKFY